MSTLLNSPKKCEPHPANPPISTEKLGLGVLLCVGKKRPVASFSDTSTNMKIRIISAFFRRIYRLTEVFCLWSLTRGRHARV